METTVTLRSLIGSLTQAWTLFYNQGKNQHWYPVQYLGPLGADSVKKSLYDVLRSTVLETDRSLQLYGALHVSTAAYVSVTQTKSDPQN